MVRSAGLEPTPQASETCTLSSWAMSASFLDRAHHNKKKHKVKQLSLTSSFLCLSFIQCSKTATQNCMWITWLILRDHSQYLNFSPFEIFMTDALILRDVSKTYRNGFQALKGINLNVPEGEFYALLGPNGAGKSTTIGIISSLTKKNLRYSRNFWS